MMKTASELRTKIGKLKTRKIEETEHNKADKIYNPHRDPSMMGIGKGNSYGVFCSTFGLAIQTYFRTLDFLVWLQDILFCRLLWCEVGRSSRSFSPFEKQVNLMYTLFCRLL